MNKVKNILIFHICMFKQVFFIFRLFRIWKKIAGCCKDNMNTFQFLILVFISIPFFLKPVPSFAPEMPYKFGHGLIMFREFLQNQEIQCRISGFNLIDSVIEGGREGAIVSEIFISLGTPEGEAMIGENAEQPDTCADKGNDDWGVYAGLLPMIIIFLVLLFSEPDKERRKRNRR